MLGELRLHRLVAVSQVVDANPVRIVRLGAGLEVAGDQVVELSAKIRGRLLHVVNCANPRGLKAGRLVPWSVGLWRKAPAEPQSARAAG